MTSVSRRQKASNKKGAAILGKRYWWLKLKEDFFRQVEIKKLRKIAGGDTYTVIYLKMMLLSLKNEGHIAYECPESEFIENLALDIDEDEENVSVTVAFLRKHNLLVESDFESDVSLPKAAEAIGSETAAASRMRDMRNRKKAGESVTLLRDSYDAVTPALRRDRVRVREEIEIEKEQELDKTATAPGVPNSFALWNSNICPMTAILSEKLQALVEEVGELPVCQAIESAVLNGVRNFNYVQAAARGIARGETKKSKPSSSPRKEKNDVEGAYNEMMAAFGGDGNG